MANLQPVTVNRHGKQRWRRFSSFAFAAQSTIAPLMLTEVRSAASALPIAFINIQNQLVPVALLGLDQGRNACIGAQGEWLPGYTPASLRVWPFSIGAGSKGERLLCVDEDSGLLTNTEDGEPFFGDDGKPAPALETVLSFLSRLTQEREPSIAAATALLAADVLEPWDVVVRADEREWSLENFMRVTEDALAALPDHSILALHRAGALALAYTQLHSRAQLPALGRRAAQLQPQAAEQ